MPHHLYSDIGYTGWPNRRAAYFQPEWSKQPGQQATLPLTLSQREGDNLLRRWLDDNDLDRDPNHRGAVAGADRSRAPRRAGFQADTARRAPSAQSCPGWSAHLREAGRPDRPGVRGK